MTKRMKGIIKKTGILITVLLLAILLVGCGNGGQETSQDLQNGQENDEPAVSPTKITVSAAASLTGALEEIKELYENSTGNTLEMNYGSSGSLQQQIEQGAPVDVFISAAQKDMNELEDKELIVEESRIDLLENVVVLIVPDSDEDKNITDFDSLQDPSVEHLAIGETESVPAGRYAKEILTNLGIWDNLEQKLVLGKDVRQVLTYVETGNVDAGIVYMTDAQSSDKVKVVATAPADSHTPIIYPATIIKDSNNQEAAEDFMAFLAGKDSASVFEKFGFTFIIN